MINNYYTIAAVAREVDEACGGWLVGRPFTQRRNELIVPVSPPGPGAERSMVFSCEPSANFIIHREGASRAARRSGDIFRGMTERTISSVSMHPSDRCVAVAFTDGGHMLFRAFGSRANVIYVAPEGGTPEYFLSSRLEREDPVYPFPPAGDLTTGERFQKAAADHPDRRLQDVLRASMPTLGPVLIRELLYRAGADGSQTAGEVPAPTLATIGHTATLMVDDLLERPSPRIVVRAGEPVHFTLITLTHLQDCDEQQQPDISRGILRYLSVQRSHSAYRTGIRTLMDALAAEIDRTVTSRGTIIRTLPNEDEISHLERCGNIIQLHLGDIEKGMSSFEAEDPFADGDVRLVIQLEPSLTPVRNAERYFSKAKSARKRRDASRARLEDLDQRVSLLRTLDREAADISGMDDLQAFFERHRDELPHAALPGKTAQAPAQAPPFRVYTVHGGFQVWVGKNSANNDLLTTRHTRKNDLWFHARSVGGSHVVLKEGSGKGEMPRQAILQAAAIAAYYSKMKNARHVAVSMCEGKFVRKPKKAPPGTVRIEREDVLFVDPMLPESGT